MRHVWLLALVLTATACSGDFTPRAKTVTVDAQTGEIVPPHPCPDWSQPTVGNYDNSNHSNYGCAVNNNMAVQLENPRDWVQGRGLAAGGVQDTEMSVHTIQRYRAGEIPAALVPQQDNTSQ